MSYFIFAKYFYLPGTFHAKKDGRLTEEGTNDVMYFTSRKHAEIHCECYLILEKARVLGGGASFWYPSGVYTLNHGEYSSPEFYIRKIRTRKKNA